MTVQYLLGNNNRLWNRSLYFTEAGIKYYFVDMSDYWCNLSVGEVVKMHIKITKEHYGEIPTLDLEINKEQLLSEDTVVRDMLLTQVLYIFNENFDL